MGYFKIINAILKSYDLTSEDISKFLDINPETYDKWVYRKVLGRISPVTFYNAVIDEGLCFGNFCTHKDFALSLYKELKRNNVFPEEWIDSVDYISGESEKFDERQLRSFVITLLNADKKKKKKEETATDNQSKFIITKAVPYFEQCVYDDVTGETLINTASLDFSPLAENKRIVIKGPGGQGKTRFVSEIKNRSEHHSCFSYVFSIELTLLMPIVEAFMLSHSGSNAVTDFILNYISDGDKKNAIKILDSALDSSKKPVLLMLDGFNELYTTTNPIAIKFLTEEIQRIGNEWSNTYILITCRSTENDTGFRNRYGSLQYYKHCTLSGVPKTEYDNFIKKHPNLSDTIKKLAAIPLYYNHLSYIEGNIPTTQFDLLLQIYGKLFRQSKCTSNDYYAFYIAAPYIAQSIDNSVNNQITPANITNIVKDLYSKNLSSLFEATLELTGDTGVFSYAEISVDKVCKILTQAGPLVLCGDSKHLKFSHDDIKDCMIAFNSIRTLKTFENCYNAKSNDFTAVSDIFANFNVSVSVAKLIKEKLGLNDIQTADNNLQRLYSNVIDDTDFELNEASILYIHTAFLIFDYVQVPYNSIKNALHKILSKATNECLLYYSNGNLDKIIINSDEKMNLRCRLALADIFSKECEYYRRRKRYTTGLNLIKAAGNLVTDNEALINQKAKLYLHLHRDIVTRQDLNEVFDINDEGLTNTFDLYSKAFSYLEYNSEEKNFNLSSSTLGLILSVPAPYLIKHVTQKFEFIKAFLGNYSTITTRKQKDYNRREIDYPIRQAVALLLKGYVQLRRGFVYKTGMLGKLNASAFQEGEKKPLHISNDTMKLAEDLLKLADGQYISGLNYLRGRIAMYNGDVSHAEELFVSEDNNILNQIILNNKFGGQYDIDTKYNEIKELILKPENKDGIADSCHPIYWYCDAKNLDLTLNPQKLEYFNKFEESLSEECKFIVSKLTK